MLIYLINLKISLMRKMPQNKFVLYFFLNLDFFLIHKSELAVIFLIFFDVLFHYLVVTQMLRELNQADTSMKII